MEAMAGQRTAGSAMIEWTKPQRWVVPGHGLAAPRLHSRFEPLATYNAERSRGIVHTQEYDAQMAELQREFDAAVHADSDGTGE